MVTPLSHALNLSGLDYNGLDYNALGNSELGKPSLSPVKIENRVDAK
jgi:hypothetical protein